MTPVEPCEDGKLYFSALHVKNHDKQHKYPQHVHVTSFEFLCLDHFGVAVNNLSHDPSREVRKRCDSQRSGNPSTQRFWTGDNKKCPCGERRREIKPKERNECRVAGTESFYLEESCAETGGADHIAPKVTIRVQISSMPLSSRCITLNRMATARRSK